MSEQPLALRLADEFRPSMPNDVMRVWGIESCAELRRLHEVNAELLEALVSIVNSAAANQAAILFPLLDDARAAIAKAEGEMK